MKDFRKRIYILVGLACFGITGTASAAAMGVAQLGQCAPSPGGLSGVIISGTSIVWEPATLGGTAGCFVIGSPTDITSTQPTMTSGDTGNVLNLVAGGGAVPAFLTFNGTNLNFVLTGFGATTTSSTACDTTVGDSCILAAGSPFSLKNTSGGVELDFTTLGTITDGGVTSHWTGLFATQFSEVGVRETTADIQAAILGGSSVSSTYSATLNVDTPNPT